MTNVLEMAAEGSEARSAIHGSMEARRRDVVCSNTRWWVHSGAGEWCRLICADL